MSSRRRDTPCTVVGGREKAQGKGRTGGHVGDGGSTRTCAGEGQHWWSSCRRLWKHEDRDEGRAALGGHLTD